MLSFGVGPALASSISYTCTGNQGTDEPAVDAAINNFAVVTINGPTACYGNFLANTMNVTIQGGTQPAVLYGSGTDLNGTVLTVSGGITVKLNSMKVTHGDNASSDGGGIYAHGTSSVQLNSSTVTANITENGGDGGGIELVHATLTANSSSITNNTASGGGGGVLATSGSPVHLTDTMISGNTADNGIAGGIDLDKSGANPGTFLRTVVTHNTAGGGGGFGGGIDANKNSLTMTDSAVTLNKAMGVGYGGGLFVRAADVSLTRTTVTQNSATYGGGIWNEGQAPSTGLSLMNSTVVFNVATSDGGGIANDSFQGNVSATIANSTVSQNRSLNGNGGGIANISEGGYTASLSIISSTLYENHALSGNGGAIANFILDAGGQATVSISQTAIGPRPRFLNDQNQAKYGGGISNDGTNGTASVSLQSSTSVFHNTASVDGGGVYNTGGGLLTIGPGSSVTSNHPDDVS